LLETPTIYVTVWFRTDQQTGSLETDLVTAAAESPFERCEDNGMCDVKWRADSMNEAISIADRLKPFMDNDSLVLLKISNFSKDRVTSMTHKDIRSSLS
jgi:hypothetical protein